MVHWKVLVRTSARFLSFRSKFVANDSIRAAIFKRRLGCLNIKQLVWNF